jgi:hypothetical protein
MIEILKELVTNDEKILSILDSYDFGYGIPCQLEIFKDGYWRVIPNYSVANRYESDGILIPLHSCLKDEMTSEQAISAIKADLNQLIEDNLEYEVAYLSD